MTDIKSTGDEIYKVLLKKRIIPSLTYVQPTNWFGNNMAARWTIAARPAGTAEELEKSSAYFRSRLVKDVILSRGIDSLLVYGPAVTNVETLCNSFSERKRIASVVLRPKERK